MKLKYGFGFFMIWIIIISGFASVWSLPFEFPPPLPQIGALGGVSTPLEGNLAGSVSNPAGLADLNGYGVALSYCKLYNQSFLGYTSIASGLSISKYGVMGLAYRNIAVKYEGAILTNEQTFTLSHGFTIMNDIHTSLDIGYSLNIYSLKYGQSGEGVDLGSCYTFGFNLGLQANIYGRTHVGVFIENVNSPNIGVEFREPLPQRLKFGLGYEPYDFILTLFEIEKEFDKDIQLHFGIEARPYKVFAVRIGTQNEPSRFSAGLGLNVGGTTFDYSMQTHPVL
ncbi:hypothetical protein JW877_08195, partial [bacterium]|nr:hypothetical protein [bacterium]